MTLLEPWSANIGKRLVKAPKLYFNDTGLLCFLLNLRERDLDFTPYAGAIFETWAYGELRKTIRDKQTRHSIYFYRDQQGREVDFLLERAGRVWLLGAKSSETPRARDTKDLHAVTMLLAQRQPHPAHVMKRIILARPPVDYPMNDGTHVHHPARLSELLS